MVNTRPAQAFNTPGAMALFPAFPALEARSGDIDNVLEQSREWISLLVRRHVFRGLIPAGEIEKEIDDLIQTTLIAFWLKLISENVQIVCPKAYIVAIVRSRCIDLVRYRKRERRVQSFVFGDDGEPSQGNDIVATLSNGGQDPTLEYEYKELIAEVAEDVLKLPSCQQRAMICLLKDEVREMSLLTEAFEEYGVDIRAVNWPQDTVALQRLRSSLSIARKKLRALREQRKTKGKKCFIST